MRTSRQTTNAPVVDINGNTVISLFAGTGGSSLGYKWAGFQELLAIDFNDHAVECFRLNFPEVPIWNRSVIDVTGQEILDFCRISKGDLSILDGSPPCQGFSTAGKRQVSDPRNDLFKHYCRLVEDLSPKVFVMENVSGMAKGPMKGKFIEIMVTLKSLNYEVKCKQMNAMYYGVPQSRERLIFIGVRKDLNKIPIFPVPSTELISIEKAFATVEGSTDEYMNIGSEQMKIIMAMRPGEDGAQAFARVYGTTRRRWFGMKRLLLNEPSKTMSAERGSALVHPTKDRALSIQEAKAICSFPQDWKLIGSVSNQWARLGNAVMPKFMQAIAETIRDEILKA